MFSRIAGLGVAGTLVLGSMTALASPAGAAAAKCAIGSWKLTKMTAVNVASSDGQKATSKLTGGGGTRLKITSSAATYDFSKSKPVNMVAELIGTKATVRFTYRKTLKYGLKLTGAAKGTFTPKPKTASGPATVHGVVLPSSDLGTQPLAPMIRAGEDVFVITAKATSSCTKKTLTLSQKAKEGDGSTTTRKIVFARTR